MEATGVYWKPVWHILAAGEFKQVLANAAHVKNVPGRKTDVNDATWLSEMETWPDPQQLRAGSPDPGAAVPASHP
jgi:transposase